MVEFEPISVKNNTENYTNVSYFKMSYMKYDILKYFGKKLTRKMLENCLVLCDKIVGRAGCNFEI